MITYRSLISLLLLALVHCFARAQSSVIQVSQLSFDAKLPKHRYTLKEEINIKVTIHNQLLNYVRIPQPLTPVRSCVAMFEHKFEDCKLHEGFDVRLFSLEGKATDEPYEGDALMNKPPLTAGDKLRNSSVVLAPNSFYGGHISLFPGGTKPGRYRLRITYRSWRKAELSDQDIEASNSRKISVATGEFVFPDIKITLAHSPEASVSK